MLWPSSIKASIYKYLVRERRETSPSDCHRNTKLFMSCGGEPAKRQFWKFCRARLVLVFCFFHNEIK